MKLVDLFRELAIHGLAQEKLVRGQKEYVITEYAIESINNAWKTMRKKYPKGSENDVTLRALIVVLMKNMGEIDKECLTDFIDALKVLAGKYVTMES
jgi:hypothetical protein